MTEKDAATLGTLVAGCRGRMESDLVELVEELGAGMLQDVSARTAQPREPERRAAAGSLKQALTTNWAKVAPALKAALAARRTKPAPAGMDSPDIANLQIMTDDQESLQIANNDALDRLTNACREESAALERRLSYLVLRSAVQPGDTTFKLAALWSCLRGALAELGGDAGAQILLLKLAATRLEAELPQIYRVINETMIEAEILPRLKRSYLDIAPVDANEVAAETAKVANTLERLVKARSKDAPAAAEKPGSGTASAELFKSLKTLQAAPRPADPGVHTNVVRTARDSGAARDVRPLEAVTLDIVAELFDLIFADPNVAEGIKGLVARLQTTVLRAAMLNQRFFADRGHPARRFLDSISTVAIRWGKVVNAEDPFYVKLAELVDQVQATYDGDMAVFDDANARLDAFLTEREAIEEQQNRELAEAVHAREEEMRARREAQLKAQKAADRGIDGLLAPGTPGVIEDFLRNYWRDVLQERIVRDGEGATVADTLRTATDLLWTVTPKNNAADRQRQTAGLPPLLKKLTTGFDDIAASPAERKAFMDMLVDLALAALRGETHAAAGAKPPPADGAPRRRAASTLQVSHATSVGVRVQDISVPGGATAVDDREPDRADRRRVRQLVRGDWVDFITAGQTRRERLTWINPSRTLLLFSNSASACAISITPEALALRLGDQSARIVTPDRPIFERAIQGAIQTLDKRAA